MHRRYNGRGPVHVSIVYYYRMCDVVSEPGWQVMCDGISGLGRQVMCDAVSEPGWRVMCDGISGLGWQVMCDGVLSRVGRECVAIFLGWVGS